MREMKDSGIEWIGEIPQEWNIARLRDIKAEKKYAIVDGPFGSAISTNDYKESGIPLIRITNLKNGEVTENDMVYISEELAEKVGRSSIGLSDIVFAKTGATIGKCGVNKTIKYGILASSCVKISISHDFDHRFFYYIFLTDQFNEALKNTCTGTTRDTINLSPFSKLNVVIPPYKIQHRIADYLDRKCSQIDAIIARQQKVIEKLKAYKLSVITEAVTKGLNPDVPMKDSGVEWIGEIPEHWILNKLKYLSLDIGDGIHATPTYDVDGNIYFVNGNNIGEEYLVFKEDTNAISDTEYASYKLPLLTENTVFITLNGATYGKTSFYHGEKVLLGKSAGFITLKSTESREFIRYYLQSYTAKLIMDLSLLGSTIANLSLRTLRDFVIPYPPKEEQIQIVNHLNNRTSGIDAAISKKKKIVDELIDYKKSLIYEVVTGKKEV